MNGSRVHLTGKEYQMLELLSLRKGTTLTKEMFLNHLYGGMDEPELKIIDVLHLQAAQEAGRFRPGHAPHRNRLGPRLRAARPAGRHGRRSEFHTNSKISARRETGGAFFRWTVEAVALLGEQLAKVAERLELQRVAGRDRGRTSSPARPVDRESGHAARCRS